MELALNDLNLPLGIALLALCAAIAAQALRLVGQGRHATGIRPEAEPVTPGPVEIEHAATIDQAHQDALREALGRHQEELAAAEALIARAGAQVCRAGLTFALTYLELELAAGCHLVEGAELVDGQGGTWHWQEATWQITRTPVPSLDAVRPFAHYSLLRDGETLLTVACQQEPNTAGPHYRFVGVQAFVMGPWVAAIVDFAGTLRTALEMDRARACVQATLCAASRISLGQGEAALVA